MKKIKKYDEFGLIDTIEYNIETKRGKKPYIKQIDGRNYSVKLVDIEKPVSKKDVIYLTDSEAKIINDFKGL